MVQVLGALIVPLGASVQALGSRCASCAQAGLTAIRQDAPRAFLAPLEQLVHFLDHSQLQAVWRAQSALSATQQDSHYALHAHWVAITPASVGAYRALCAQEEAMAPTCRPQILPAVVCAVLDRTLLQVLRDVHHVPVVRITQRKVSRNVSCALVVPSIHISQRRR